MHSIQEFKVLRKSIVAVSIVKHGWQPDELHDIMEEWGFGRSLRALSWYELQLLKCDLLGIKSNTGYARFDKQGMKMWSLAKQAWPGRTMKKLQAFWVKRFHKLHWNILDEDERRGTMNMLRRYLKTAETC